MTPDPTAAVQSTDPAQEPVAPACVMSFNASEPSGAGGLAGDIATISAMGAHALPVVTTIVMRDTAEVFDHHPLEAEVVVEQARSILEDITLAGWKVGFLGSADAVSAVAEVLSD
ncbi:MAG: bifunctional hydroxymethylpyrimidine kinase/phosphomethylpyrimidine kinase, partial [Rubrivivax sp.]